VAVVSSTGLVTTASVGAAVITATQGGVSGSTTVDCRDPDLDSGYSRQSFDRQGYLGASDRNLHFQRWQYWGLHESGDLDLSQYRNSTGQQCLGDSGGGGGS
jgi:hypothetical protein